MKKGWISGGLLLLGALQAWAGECTFGEWHISKEGSVSTWPGSVEAAIPPQWTVETEWQMNRGRVFKNKKRDIYAICEITADSNYAQGLSMTYPAGAVRLNGKVLDSYKTAQMYQLDLVEGKNVFEIKMSPLSPLMSWHGQILTRVDLDDIFVPLEKKIFTARQAVTALGEKYSDYDSAKYLKELAALEKAGANEAKIEDFRYQALVLNNPEVDFDEIVFRSSNNEAQPANWRGNSYFLRRGGKETQEKYGDELVKFNLKDRSVQSIYKPTEIREGLMDLCLSYEGDKFLYSGVKAENNTFQIYEMNVDGSGKRQITPDLKEIDHYNAVYLPNGKLLFCSTASLNSVPCVYGNDYVGNLFEINSDGTDMRQVTFDQENDWYPWVMESGRVMYSRWEYTDNAHYFTRILMQMNPDGTNLRSMYGSNSYWPNTMFYAKSIPGHPSKFVAITSGHHGVDRAGEITIFDTAKGEFEADGVVRQIPGVDKEVKPVVIDQYMAGKWPRFLHPMPLSENYFLVAGQLCPDEKWSLYLVDTFDNMIKLYSSDKQSFEPIPVKARKRPPVIADRRNFEAKDATLFIQDIYQGPGLENVPKGSVKFLRIFTYGYAYRMHGGHDALAIEGGWDTKRIIGTVPVEEDGSVMVKVPHSLPLSLQPLDKDGNALQLMRSWLTTMPGENLSCVGCHESARMAPPSAVAIAARKAPRTLTPWANEARPYGFSFLREVQPVLDRNCVGCHSGNNNRPNFKDITEDDFGKAPRDRRFSKSYQALHPYARRPGPESDMHLLPPMEYHTSTSELMQLLDKGHNGVKLSADDRLRLATWIDLNVPYHGTWMAERNNDAGTKAQAEQIVEFKKRYAGLNDDIEWMPEAATTRPEFIWPKAMPKKQTAMTMKGWPLSEEQVLSMAGETKQVQIGNHTLTFAKIPAGRFVMGSVDGGMDEAPQAVVEIEKPFWMSVKEITNGEFRDFDAQHDSGAIDQQWKDHIFPGYAANKDEQPAIRMSWAQAMDYTRWASAQTGMKVTLPTEAQWEWAARAGSDKPFYFGDSGFEKFGNFADKMIGELAVVGVDPKPLPVKDRSPLTDFVPRDESFDDGILIPSGTAQYAANPWGLYDMHGNVSEWTRSDYAAYPYSATDGRNDGNVKERKVVRGGSWRDRPYRATASFRLPYEAHQKVFNVGIRLIIEE
jgi:formylglycine-generating enzyme required for sulfatase activity